MDAETRAAAEAAARQAGLSLDAWLRQTVAERAAAEGVVPEAGSAARDLDDEDAGGIAASLASLGAQVRAMTAEVQNGHKPAAERELAEIVARLSRELQDIDEKARSTVEGQGPAGRSPKPPGLEDAIRSLEAHLAALNRRAARDGRGDPAYDDVRDRLDALLARAPGPSQPAGADLERTLRDLESRLAEADRTARGTPLSPDEDARVRRIRARLTEIGDRLAAPAPRASRPAPPPDPLAAAIADIARRQNALAGKAEAPDASPAAIAALRAEVVVLSDRIADLLARERSGQEAFGRLAGRLDTIAAAGQATAAAMAGTLERIGVALDRMAAERAGNVDATAVKGLADGLAALRAKVEAMELGRKADSESLRRVESRLDDLARRDPAALIRGVEDRIDDLAARLDAIVRVTPQAAPLDDVRAEIARIREEFAAREARGIEGLERQVRELAERIAAATEPQSGADQLAALEARVEALAADLGRSTPRAASLEQIEENLVRLQASLIEGRQESIEAARAAARNAIRELGAPAADSGLVAALRRDLDDIRALITAADRPDAPGADAVKEAVASVAEHIGIIAEESGPPAKSAPRRPYVVTAAEPHIPRAEPRMRPDMAAIRELAASAGAGERKPAGRRADFIAAARRAAQAAVADADAGGGVTLAERPPAATVAAGHSPFARIGEAIRARRRPLLLAAAAIVLAIGALQIFGRPVETAQAVPPAEDPKPAAVIVHRPPAATSESPRAAVPRIDGAALVPPVADARSAMALADPDITGSVAGAPSVAPASALAGAGTEALRLAAAAGDPVAAFEIATRFAEGRDAPRDLAEAARWYQRAADSGLAPAQYRLGSLYERGQGVGKDLGKAVALYAQAARAGNAGAMHNLAVLVSEGAAGKPDPKQALEWFLAAAGYGVKDSQYNLGVIYARGLGAPENLPESYKWFAIAAQAGDKDAAARRDEVAALLDQDKLALARAAVKAFRPKTPPPAANVVTLPAGRDGNAGGVTAADQKALVQKIQTLLAEQGYDPGPADGVEGARTREAVRAFQARAGLAITGLIDRSLVAALARPTG